MPQHRGHNTVAVKEILEAELESLRQNSFEDAERMLLKVREAVDSVSHMADSLKEKGEKTKARIQMHFKEIRDTLETREQNLLNTTEEIVLRKVTKLENQEEVLVKSREDLEIKVFCAYTAMIIAGSACISTITSHANTRLAAHPNTPATTPASCPCQPS